MQNTDKTNFFDAKKSSYYRFTKQEIMEQKIELEEYILSMLTSADLTSIQESIKEIKDLTGIELSLEKAIELKRLAALTSGPTEEPQVKRR